MQTPTLFTCIALPVAAGLAAPTADAQCPDWSPLGAGADDTVYALCVHDDGSGAALFAGGDFANAGGAPASHLARWDGASWSEPGGGTDGPIEALIAYDDGSGPALYVGGSFTTAGITAAAGVARWDGADWSALGTGVTGGTVLAFAVFDGGGGAELYAGGTFDSAGGVEDTTGIARWNGTGWSSVGGVAAEPFFSPTVRALWAFDDGTGPALYAGGGFSSAGGVPAIRVARFDGTSWSALGTGAPWDVVALSSLTSAAGPRLYASIEGVSGYNPIRVWEAGVWTDVGSSSRTVATLLPVHGADGPALLAGAGGGLHGVGGTVALYDGTSWSPTPYGGVGGFPGPAVESAAVFDAGDGPAIVVGGRFDYAGPVAPLDNVAALAGPCLDNEAYCYADDTTCPCANGGSGGGGCDNAQSTGGVRLVVQGFAPDGAGAGTATLVGTGFPPGASPTVVVVRSRTAARPTPLGDGLLCLGLESLTRVVATTAAAGATAVPFGHGAGAGDFFYQLWFRNQPATFCTPQAFGLSNGYRLAW